MLKPEQNELLTRVENGAPMGRYLRETAWFPAVLSAALKPDDPPFPVRLVGENFVAFRGMDGKVGFLSEYCPHRGASLLLARNEDNALRCIFHGWKFSVDGVTVEAPTQPTDHDAFCKKVPLESHPIHEAVGIVWVWLGEGEPAPFPKFDFMKLDGDNICPVHSVQNYNWFQAVEGLVDSAHVSILHQDWLAKIPSNPKLLHAVHDTAPIYEFDATPHGFRYAALRCTPSGAKYVRITDFVAPWYTFPPGEQMSCFITVPIDDEHTAFWSIRHDPNEAVKESPWKPPPGADHMNWPPPLPGDKSQRWGQNREVMKHNNFSGFPQHLFHEDVAVAISQGKITKRNKEFLNGGDVGVVRARSLLLRELAEMEQREGPPSKANLPIRITAGHGLLAADLDWRTEELA